MSLITLIPTTSDEFRENINTNFTELAENVDFIIGTQNHIQITEIIEQFAISSSGDYPSVVTALTEIPGTTTGTTQRLRSIAYGTGVYVAVGHSGAAIYSYDLLTWQVATAFSTNAITTVCYGKGYFVCVDSGGGVYKSADGIAWTALTLPSGFSGQTLESITFANGRFIVCGGNLTNTTGFVAFSDDLISWEVIGATLSNVDFTSVTYGLDKYVMVSTTGAIWYSTDGRDWADCGLSNTTYLREISYCNNKFVTGGAGGLILYSVDGLSWSTATVSTTYTISDIRGFAFCNNRYYASSYTSTGVGVLFVSDDAQSWTQLDVSTGRLWCLYTNDAYLLSVGDNGVVSYIDFDIEWLNYKPFTTSYVWHRLIAFFADSTALYTKAVCYLPYNSTVGSTTQPVYFNQGVPTVAHTIPTTTSELTNNNGFVSSLSDLGITATANEINVLDGITATTAELNYVDGATSNIQTQINAITSGTITSVSGTAPISATTASGAVTVTHATSGVTASTYRSVTVNAYGHVTAGTNPTTLSGYGITDAKIASGVITLGSNTITPLTADSTLSAAKLSGTIPSTVLAVTASTGTSNTQIATTAFVQTEITSNKLTIDWRV